MLCVGGLLAACGGDGRDGRVATGAAGDGPQQGRGEAVAPRGDVEFVPLDGGPSGKPSRQGGTGAEPGGNGSGSGGSSGTPAGPDSKSAEDSGGSRPPDAPGGSAPGRGDGDNPNEDNEGARPSSPGSPGSTGSPGSPGGESPRPPSAPSKPGTSAPPRPAALKVGEPRRRAAEKRWCEDVTVSFRNTGGSPVRSGSVTLGTHIIGALGVDWGTIESTRKLPAPIGAGKTVKKTWLICVDWWRVPLGMHVETRDVDIEWK
ncbi:hypothetical protein STRAU_3124 [Streptomyces aurantiacus JA 4570]|uniref:Uncharacterized protein n=1 Tax=Streptomyces aurantiacus JA 4570 TaxID=1286094 RepID=S3ZJQ1_9ACTN|nr:hypothetical protein STRAU_3124 [Streptomyces aurantiacus JA 4570]